jgi:hypothetical protein
MLSTLRARLVSDRARLMLTAGVVLLAASALLAVLALVEWCL